MVDRLGKISGSGFGKGGKNPLEGIPASDVEKIKAKLIEKGFNASQIKASYISFVYDALYEDRELTNDLLKQVLALSNNAYKKVENKALVAALKSTIEELKRKSQVLSDLEQFSLQQPSGLNVMHTNGPIAANGMSAQAYAAVTKALSEGQLSIVVTKEGVFLGLPGLKNDIDPEKDLESKRQAAYDETDRLISELPQDSREYLEAVMNFAYYFVHSTNELSVRITNGETLEYKDLENFLNEVVPKLNLVEELKIKDVLNPGEKLKLETLFYVATKISIDFLLPRGVYFTAQNGQAVIEPIIYEPREATSPDGHTIPVYISHPHRQNKGNDASSVRFLGNSIVYTHLVDKLFSLEGNVELFNPDLKGVKDSQTAQIVRDEINDFYQYQHAVESEAYLKTEEPENFRYIDSLAEELEHLDCKKLAEKRLGKEILYGIYGREVEEARAVLKSGPLLDELESKGDLNEQTSFAKAILEVRAKIGMLRVGERRYNFTPYSFIDAIGYAIDVKKATYEIEEEPHYDVARNINKHLIGEKLLGVTGKALDDPKIWFKFLDENISVRVGVNTIGKTEEFILKLHKAAQEVLEENFYLS